MVFSIQIKYSGRIYPMTVERIKVDKSFEEFRIFNPKTPEKYIIIQSNRPLLLAKGLKKHRINWTVLEGHVTYKQPLTMVIQLIESHLNPETTPKNRLVDTDRISFNNKRRDLYNGNT
jgi:hypothetical protein